MSRSLIGAVLVLAFASGCTMKSTRSTSADTTTPDAKSTGQVQQGVGSADDPASPPSDSGKAKPKASDLSNPTTK